MRRLPVVMLVVLLAGPRALNAQTAPPEADARIQKLVASVSEERLATIVQKLAGFGTRNTLSDTTSPTRGIGAARQWIFDELTRSSPKLQVSFDTYQIARQGRITRNVELRNVIALLPGKSLRRIYITAHYDTVNIGEAGQIGANTRAPSNTPPPDPQRRPNQNYNVDAPGANDNGSGTALTMELARVFAESGLQFDATLAFALWAGEEQGLIGSRVHATRIARSKTVVDANFNNDIIGNSTRRRRHDRRGIRARLFRGTGGLDVAIAGPLHRARLRRCTSHPIGSASSRGRIGSAAAATTRPLRSWGFRPSRSVNRKRTSADSMGRPTPWTVWTCGISRRTRA